MKRNYGLAVAVIAGIVFGALASQLLRAQNPPMGYYMAEVFEVSNPDQFKIYAAGVPATVEKYGGRFLVRGGKTESLEGEPPKRIVVIAFNSAADAKKWYTSPEYSAIRPIRQGSAKSRGFIAEGVGE